MEFLFQLPTRVLFGFGKSDGLAEVLHEFQSKKVFLATDEGIIKAGIIDPIVASLKQQGISVFVYSDIESDPSADCVDKACGVFNAGDYDSIVAVGGGSPLDTAKAIRVVATNGGSVIDYDGVNLVRKTPHLPLITLPTTAGTGSEVTIFGVYADLKRNIKFNITSPHMAPTVSIVDPKLTIKSPKRITAASGIDSLAHAIEALYSNKSMPASDGLALESIRLIAPSLQKAVHYGEDVEARVQMSHGSLLAGMAFNNAYLGLTHAIGSALSGHCHVAHGVSIGLILPYVIAFNAEACPVKTLSIAEAMGIEGERHEKIAGVSPKVLDMVADIGLPTRLREVNAKPEQLKDMAKDTFTNRMLQFNPRQPSESEVLELLEHMY